MKTIFKDGVYDRVDDVTGDYNVRVNGWKFVPKSEWKVKDRDFGKAEKLEKAKSEKAAKAEKK